MQPDVFLNSSASMLPILGCGVRGSTTRERDITEVIYSWHVKIKGCLR